jgi:uncharacterized protein (DUF1330 family)
MAVINCKYCGKEKKVLPVHKRTGRAKYCSLSCASKDKKGESARAWKGGKYIDGGGYVFVKKEDHPHKNKDGYVNESHIVAERTIGRYLREGEIVHHINGLKGDNRPENLVVMTNSDHVKQHGIIAEINKTKKRSGTDNPFYNKQHSPETKQKMSVAKKGIPLSDEHRASMRKARTRYLESCHQ